MRLTHEYLSLQLAHDAVRRDALVRPANLTVARFESVYREMSGFGMLDLVFECDDEVFVAHAVGVDLIGLALREGPALLWPRTLALDPAAADAIEDAVTPWLRALTRGRSTAGEEVRTFAPSAIFATARERGFYGAVACGESIARLGPFVYARRFARGRDVLVACADAELAAAAIGTVARAVRLGAPADPVAARWYGRPPDAADFAPSVGIVDALDDERVRALPYVVATRAQAGARRIVVPVPVPNDHLFTFDPADAPEAASFAVRAVDIVERERRGGDRLAGAGASHGKVALVVREDAGPAPDADTDAVAELERRLRAEGLDARTVGAADAFLDEADIVHVVGAIDDAHLPAATDRARRRGVPFVVSVAPRGPYAAYDERGLLAALRLGIDSAEREQYLRQFAASAIRFADLAHERTAEESAALDCAFEQACAGAAGIILDASDDPAAFCARYGGIDPARVVRGAAFLAPEPAEEAIAESVPAQPFVLLAGPLTIRSGFGSVLSALGETPLGVVVAGPVSEVDVAFTLRRIAGSAVVFLPDPTLGQEAALYRRARAVAFPALRPTGASRLLRAALCGAVPLVAAASPLASLVPPAWRFEHRSAEGIAAAIRGALDDPAAGASARALATRLAPLADGRAALDAVFSVYARAATAAATP